MLSLAVKLTAFLMTRLARVVTGMRSFWAPATAPSAEATVYFGNHNSHIDFVLIWASLPQDLRQRTRPVAASDYWGKPGIRSFIGIKVINALLIDRKATGNTPNPVDQMAASLKSGDSLIIFPEGTRNTTEALMLPFRSGLYHLAKACPEARLVPVWIDNLKRVLPKGMLIPVPLGCTLQFGQAMSLQEGESKEAFLLRAEQALLQLCPPPTRADFSGSMPQSTTVTKQVEQSQEEGKAA